MRASFRSPSPIRRPEHAAVLGTTPAAAAHVDRAARAAVCGRAGTGAARGRAAAALVAFVLTIIAPAGAAVAHEPAPDHAASEPGPSNPAASPAGVGARTTGSPARPSGIGSRPAARLPDLIVRPPVWPPDEGSWACGLGVSPAAIIGAPIETCSAETPDDRWLRFGSTLGNAGDGPLRLVLTRPSDAVETMSATQRVKVGRRWTSVASGALARWGQPQDGHRHWHVDAMEAFRLYPVAGPGDVGLGVKRGFCFFDGFPLPGRFPGRAPYPGRYGYYSCQGYTLLEADAIGLTRMVVGLSVGWSDTYPWNYAGQRIDLATVPDGDYLLCLTADPLGVVTETDETNNESWSRISIATVAGPPYSVAVTELARGRGACAAQLTDPIPAATSAASPGRGAAG